MGGGALPTFDTGLSFNPVSGQYDLDSSDNAHASTYTIELTGTLPDGTTDTITFSLTLDPCEIVTSP